MSQLLNFIVLCLKRTHHVYLQIFHFHLHLLLVKCSLDQSGALLPLTIAVAPQQMVGRLGCCVDTAYISCKRSAALPAVLGVAECSLSDVLLQTDPGRCLDCQGLGRCEGEGYLETPEGNGMKCSV